MSDDMDDLPERIRRELWAVLPISEMYPKTAEGLVVLLDDLVNAAMRAVREYADEQVGPFL